MPGLGAVVRLVAAAVAAAAAALVAAPVALAHGGVVPEAPTVASFLFGWSFDPMVWLPAIVAVLLWRAGVVRANRAHPGRPVDRRRTAAWVAGIVVILIALDSGFARYDTTLFSLHMVQHLLLTLVATPLLGLAGPITLLLQASSAATRRRWILPLLHARIVRVLAFPVVAWILFAAVMWGTHFSALFDASLETPWLHYLEHGLYLATSALFWWPVVGPDPAPWRMPPAVRPLYVGLQMTQNTFLAVAIYMAGEPMYAHYVSTVRTWGPTPLADQQMAGGIMWLGGDLAFLSAIVLLVAGWMRDEERRAPAEDRRLEPERAAIREREARLAARRASELGGEGAGRSAGGSPGAGASADVGARDGSDGRAAGAATGAATSGETPESSAVTAGSAAAGGQASGGIGASR